MYRVPICPGCQTPLAVVEEHTHQYLRDVTGAGKTGRPRKVGYRHVVDERLKCPTCHRMYLVKRDTEQRIIRGRAVRIRAAT